MIRRPRRRALALVMTLWLTVVLVALVYGLIYDIQIEIRLRRQAEDDLRARWLAHAGVAKAIADLCNDMVIERSEDNTPADARGDVWAYDDEDKTAVPLGDSRRRPRRDESGRDMGSFTVRVTDGESRINVNAATVNLLRSLFIVQGERDTYLAQRRAEAIIDWRDRNTAPGSPDAEPGLQETEWWSLIAPDEFGLEWTGTMHNDRFLTVDELVSVPGMTRDLLMTPGALTREGGSHRRQARSRRGTAEALALRDCLTTLSNGQININTAPREVLGAMILCTIGPDGAWEEIADAIIERRDGRNLDDRDDDTPFLDVNEIQSVAGATGLISQTEDFRMTVRSETFIISASGDVGTVHRSIVTEVRRDWEVYVDNAMLDLYRRPGAAQAMATSQAALFATEQARRSSRAGRDRNRTGEGDADATTERPAVRILSWMEN